MKKLLASLLVVAFCISLIGCATIKVAGNAQLAPSSAPAEKVASKKVWYLFGGLIPLGDNTTDSIIPQNAKVKVETKFTFMDFIISGLTGGLIATKTAQVYQVR